MTSTSLTWGLSSCCSFCLQHFPLRCLHGSLYHLLQGSTQITYSVKLFLTTILKSVLCRFLHSTIPTALHTAFLIVYFDFLPLLDCKLFICGHVVLMSDGCVEGEAYSSSSTLASTQQVLNKWLVECLSNPYFFLI